MTHVNAHSCRSGLHPGRARRTLHDAGKVRAVWWWLAWHCVSLTCSILTRRGLQILSKIRSSSAAAEKPLSPPLADASPVVDSTDIGLTCEAHEAACQDSTAQTSRVCMQRLHVCTYDHGARGIPWRYRHSMLVKGKRAHASHTHTHTLTCSAEPAVHLRRRTPL